MAFPVSSVANQDPCVREISVRTGEVLEDSGRPWREKRLGAERVARAFRALGDAGRAARCRDCGTTLVFRECNQRGGDHYRQLVYANFCRERLCPMCAWRRSLRLSWLVSKVFHAAYELQPNWRWVMLTLTVRNVPDERLAEQITELLAAWSRLRKREDLRVVRGWFRVLEITHNDRERTWHPHIHAVLWVTSTYGKGGSGYIPHRKWVELWRDALRVDYDPWVEVHMIRPRGAGDVLSKAAAEVAKYTTKDSDLWSGLPDEEVTRRVAVLQGALHGRRLYAWGGELRRIAQVVGAEDVEDPSAAELVHVGDGGQEVCPVCASGLVEHVFRWISRVQQYVG